MELEVRERKYTPLASDDREIGRYAPSTRPLPSWPRRLLRRIGLLSIPSFFALLFVLIIVSVISFFIALFDIEDGITSFQETTLGILSQRGAEVKPGWHMVNLSGVSDRMSNYEERPTLTQSFFSPECGEAWIATGTLCDEIMHRVIPYDLQKSMKLSTVHTWVNGSDTQLSVWKDAIIKNGSGVTLNGWRRPVGNVARHFRTHGELLYSMRSVVRSFRSDELDTLHLVTADLPFNHVPNTRLGQVPTWLSADQTCASRIETHHHWEIFRQHGAINEDEDEWKANILPSFNSIGIETQLVSLASKMGHTFIYFNDDFFLTRDVTRSDFSTPLFGPVFRMQNHLLVSSTPKGQSKADPEGEWPSLNYANWLLDQRFGARKRPYLQHFVKTFSSPLLQELTAVWGEELTESSEVRFRGAGNGKALGLPFLATHYVVERHREALLWSFIVARSDRDHSGTLSYAERTTLLSEIGYTHNYSIATPIHVIPMPKRGLNVPVDRALKSVGLTPPFATEYGFTSSQGGYPYVWLEGRPKLAQGGSYVLIKDLYKKPGMLAWPQYAGSVVESETPVACTMKILDCFGADFVAKDSDSISVENTLKRIAFEKPQCGDCIIQSLLGTSGKIGFSSFLPPASSSDEFTGPAAPDVSKNWTDGRYDGTGGRTRAISLLQRYSYSLGDSPSEFVAVRFESALAPKFKRLTQAVYKLTGPAFVVLNDELHESVSDVQLQVVHDAMSSFMNTTWPEKMCWEV